MIDITLGTIILIYIIMLLVGLLVGLYKGEL